MATTTTTEPIVLETTTAGRIVWDEETGLVYLLTPCCHASAKGTTRGIVCRGCYAPVGMRYADGTIATSQVAAANMAAKIAGMIRLEEFCS